MSKYPTYFQMTICVLLVCTVLAAAGMGVSSVVMIVQEIEDTE